MGIDKEYLDKLYKAAYNASKYKKGYCRFYMHRVLSENDEYKSKDKSHYVCSNCLKKDNNLCWTEIPTINDANYFSLVSPDVIMELINIYNIHMRTRNSD